ncbi:acetyl-CoA carboxylase biotin carboxylase subunit [Acetoanaerobium pronyense]|uniref:Biotin carboxylase n=1 Tax=Acetoanaerobium pronyense TaxID=1482736 RepID=A0ABS4KMR4_9FIRM|nr:acetyl-CoA carboxylase biotin carboxylase subunit [Acetoanaerobium pronyense]MBP2029045.1 acetyl-CoA carboxylase biotin carboxylase subunit [Acetoanaerobium pronyense]
MFNKVLIANRGEIAVRIIRTLRDMGIVSVAVYSEEDKSSLHVQLADEAICIGPAKSKDSYLNIVNILSAATISGVDAIHPGFGFLSENPRFAKMCEECKIKFIGPSHSVIDMMGDKSKAKELMSQNKIPIIPGSDGAVKDVIEAKKIADEIGYPVLLKAASGGGGKGMRIANSSDEIKKAFEGAAMEAKSSFGDDRLYLEKVILNPKHIEFQILADEYGNVIHLGERDCSIQRRNQKIIEEAPSPVIDKSLRDEMGKTAVRAAKAVGYKNAGTIEFLLDKDGSYYFMEMNTRVQVEHPITEMVTGIDIIKEQIKIAAGERLSHEQKDIRISGHSIECRVNAEDPYRNFAPTPGNIIGLHIPSGIGVRVDSFIYQGCKVSPHYDSMVAKLIVHGRDRAEAMSRMKRALGEFIIDGIKTNIDYHFNIMDIENYKSGDYDTGFINTYMGVD